MECVVNPIEIYNEKKFVYNLVNDDLIAGHKKCNVTLIMCLKVS